jgi:hypothetical protein
VPLKVSVPQSALSDQERLLRTRLPEAETAQGWVQGVRWMAQPCSRTGAEVRLAQVERRLNALRSSTRTDGLGIHFIHVRSARPPCP